jgi:hypothetical protein
MYWDRHNCPFFLQIDQKKMVGAKGEPNNPHFLLVLAQSSINKIGKAE